MRNEYTRYTYVSSTKPSHCRLKCLAIYRLSVMWKCETDYSLTKALCQVVSVGRGGGDKIFLFDESVVGTWLL